MTPLRLDDIDREIHATEQYLDSLKDVRAVVASREFAQMAAESGLGVPISATPALDEVCFEIPVTGMNGNGHVSEFPEEPAAENEEIPSNQVEESEVPPSTAAAEPPADDPPPMADPGISVGGTESLKPSEMGPVDPHQFTPDDELQAQILALLNEDGQLSTKRIALDLDAEVHRTEQLLLAMKEAGTIARGRGGVWKIPESRPTAPADTRSRASLAGDGKRAYELIKNGEACSTVSIAEALDIKTSQAAAICTGLMADRLIKSAGPGLYMPIEGN